LSGLGLAIGINLLLLFVLMGLGVLPPPKSFKGSKGTIVDLIPESRSAAPTQSRKEESRRPRSEVQKPVPKAPRIILPVKPTIEPPLRSEQPWIEMSSADMAASDISKMRATRSGSAGDSEAVGHGHNGEVLYDAEWALRQTNAELGGYLPANAPDGYGLVACKTIPGNRVEDCIALDQYPQGSHLAGAVMNAAWQFRVRPPRKDGRPLVGSWVQIRIDYVSRN
jgi:protein TonB